MSGDLRQSFTVIAPKVVLLPSGNLELDPKNTGVTLKTIAKAAAVLGGQIRVLF